MSDRPHDVTDLYLAPVLLAVDARIEELGKLDKDGLAYEVALESNSPDFKLGAVFEGSCRPFRSRLDANARIGLRRAC